MARKSREDEAQSFTWTTPLIAAKRR